METIIQEYSVHFIKLLSALLLGILVGIERQFAGKTAGMKTHALVSMGSALFVIISIIISNEFKGITAFDPLRVASNIIVGVGFIGGGAIFLKNTSISGLTTAANLWLAAGIGMACGFGLYPVAIFVTLLSIFVFIILGLIERKFRKDKPQEK